MNCSVLILSPSNKPFIEFRGRRIPFWTAHRYKELSFYQLTELPAEDPFVLLFCEDKLVDAGPQFFNHVHSALIGLSATNDCIYSVSGHPFYVVPTALLDVDVVDDLRKGKAKASIQLLDIEAPFHVWCAPQHCQQIERVVKGWQIEYLLKSGVTIEDFDNFYMEGILPLGRGSRISSGCVLKGNTVIGGEVTLYPGVYIEGSVIKDRCTILPGCIIRDSTLEENIQIGPCAHLRNGALLKRDAKVGNFVEIKKSVVGEGSKAMHLTYLGDADIGEHVNIGAGTITCNFDGKKKNKTTIEDGVFIGSGTQLIAPIVVGENSYVGAGSTVNQNVPAGSLAVARQKQRNIRGWGKRKKKG
jgi:bifunctional UDP-N-acetylglucosamine pyrophosphorylase/glucosamine-1-phosphate N-acetyltransferase